MAVVRAGPAQERWWARARARNGAAHVCENRPGRHFRGVNRPWGTRGARAGKTLGTRGARAPQNRARAQNGVILDLRFTDPLAPRAGGAFPLYNIKREKWGLKRGGARDSGGTRAQWPPFLEFYGAGALAHGHISRI